MRFAPRLNKSSMPFRVAFGSASRLQVSASAMLGQHCWPRSGPLIRCVKTCIKQQWIRLIQRQCLSRSAAGPLRQSWPGGVGAPTCRPDMSAKTACRRTCRPADSVGVSADMSAANSGNLVDVYGNDQQSILGRVHSSALSSRDDAEAAQLVGCTRRPRSTWSMHCGRSHCGTPRSRRQRK